MRGDETDKKGIIIDVLIGTCIVCPVLNAIISDPETSAAFPLRDNLAHSEIICERKSLRGKNVSSKLQNSYTKKISDF